MKNNLLYASNSGTWLLWCEGVSEPEPFAGLAMDHNLMHHSGKAAPCHWGPNYRDAYDFTQAAWAALPGAGHGAGDVSSDPQLVNVTTHDVAADKKPRPGSPARRAGAAVGVAEDFDDVARSTTTPTLGAYEG